MKTLLITLMTVLATASLMAEDKPKSKKKKAGAEAATEQTTTGTAEQPKPTSVTRKQAQDSGDKPIVPEDAAATAKSPAVKDDQTRGNRKQTQTEGKPAVKEKESGGKAK